MSISNLDSEQNLQLKQTAIIIHSFICDQKIEQSTSSYDIELRLSCMHTLYTLIIESLCIKSSICGMKHA